MYFDCFTVKNVLILLKILLPPRFFSIKNDAWSRPNYVVVNKVYSPNVFGNTLSFFSSKNRRYLHIQKSYDVTVTMSELWPHKYFYYYWLNIKAFEFHPNCNNSQNLQNCLTFKNAQIYKIAGFAKFSEIKLKYKIVIYY